MPKSANKTTASSFANAPSSGKPASDRLERVSLPAKIFFPATETEIDCVVTDLTPEGAAISIARKLDMPAEAVLYEAVLYIEGFERFSATIATSLQDVTRVKFNCSELKRRRAAEKIAAYLRGSLRAETELRRASPSPLSSCRTFRRQNGTTANFEVIDISLLGALLRTSCRPSIGEVITIGSTEGRVARYIDHGIVIDFVRPNARAVEPGESLP